MVALTFPLGGKEPQGDRGPSSGPSCLYKTLEGGGLGHILPVPRLKRDGGIKSLSPERAQLLCTKMA